MKLRIGTRRSPLAQIQAREVAGLIEERSVATTEVVPVATDDASTGDKARFVSALETALLDGEIDIAVHSAKDVPGVLASGTSLAAVPEREDNRDAVILSPALVESGCDSIENLPPGADIGTSSLRRQAQLLAIRPDLRIGSLRGNVDTRIAAMADGRFDAIVLAVAGLRRLGREDVIAFSPSFAEMLPAAGQGALLLQVVDSNDAAMAAAATLDHSPSRMALLAERATVRSLGADCDSPVGASASLTGDVLRVTAWAGRADGTIWIRDAIEVASGNPEGAGGQLARRMRSAGAVEILHPKAAE